MVEPVRCRMGGATNGCRHLQHGELFNISGKAEPDAYIICITFQNEDASLHLPVEVALVHKENPRCTVDEARDVLVDFVDYYFDRYFKGARHVTLPIDWKDFPFGEFTLRARGWERNKKLEDAADRLLAGQPIDQPLD